MRAIGITLAVIMASCQSHDNYQVLLSRRVAEMEKMVEFDNSVVVYDERRGFGTTFPFWDSSLEYYDDDVVWDEKNLYEASDSSRGQKPSNSPSYWRVIPVSRPYLFFRDTAKVEDLRNLLGSKNFCVKTYAFGALSHRRVEGLFEVILKNLNDTTRMTQMTSDYGFDVSPADLMISYEQRYLTEEEVSELKKLILEKYTHLTHARELLDDGQLIRL